jgi:beta-lactamase regulating signal transducer with metallopeptidase domain
MTALPVVLVWGLKATPLLVGAWFVTALLRRSSAATRHFVWVLATGAALALPAATTVAPRFEVALPAIAARRPVTSEPDRTTAGTAASAATAAAPAVTVESAAPGAPAAETARFPVTAGFLTRIWALGAGFIAMLLGLSLWRTARLARRVRPVAHVGVLRDVRDLAERLGVRRPVRVLQDHDQSMPMTWGLRHPTVLVPAGFVAWPRSRRRAVLVHELAHVRRWDWVTQLGARLACALYWWNPLAWVAARRLREERERACDDLVLAHGTVPSAYAGDLLEIARAFRAGPSIALAGVAMARRSELAGRLLAVLDAARSRRSLAPGRAWSATAAAAVLLLPAAGLATGARPHASAFAPVPAVPTFAPPVTGSPIDAAAAPDEPTAAPAQSSAATLCDWTVRGGRSSSSTNINDDRMTIQVGRDDCTITVRAEGEPVFSDDDRDLRQISRNGYFEIEERSGRSRRRVELADDRGGLERRWFVDGREQPYGDEARAWLGDVLLVLVRRAGINAEARAVRILTTQGEDALIAEIAQLQSDHVAGLYYRVLFERGELGSAQVARLLADAAERVDSDHELGRILATIAARGPMDADVQQAYVRATRSLDSDHEHSEALLALIAAGTLDAGAMDAILASVGHIGSDFNRARVLLMVGEQYPTARPLPAAYLDAVGGMESDHERGRVLTQLLERDRLSAADRARVLGVVARIESDHTRSQILIAVAAQGPLDDVTRDAFFSAVSGMGSDHDRQQVLTTVVAGVADEATTLAVLDAARALASDHSKTQVLTAVAAKGPMSDRVRAAYLAAAQTIGSSSSRDRALRAAGLRGT